MKERQKGGSLEHKEESQREDNADLAAESVDDRRPLPSRPGESEAEVSSARAAWEKKILGPVLARAGERKAHFRTTSDIELDRLYCPEERSVPWTETLGFPGDYPFTRGIQPTMYRSRYWTMRQYAGFGTAAESNKRYHYLLSQGQSGLSVAFDLPTQMGYDSDNPMAAGEVGRTGVAIDSLDDMHILLKDLPLDKLSTSMTINATAAILLSLYATVAEERSIPAKGLKGTIQNDILKEYMARGTYIYPPRPSMRLITDTFSWCREHMPKWNTISISGYHIREAGSTAVQEVAFTLADGIAYVEAALSAGLAIDDFGPRLSFFFNVHNNFLEEIAKFRAARRLWARIMRERFGARNPKSWKLRFHAQTAGSSLTAEQPHVNVVRVTLQALAAVLGGTQSLHTNSLDEALALPTEASALLALRTQQVIALESGVTDTVDPLGGSFALEHLTDEIEARAMKYIETIDGMGGMVAAIEEGYPQREIQDAAYRYQLEVESGERPIIGINTLKDDNPSGVPLLRVDPSLEEAQVEAVRRLKATRDAGAVKDALRRLEDAAAGTDNLIVPIKAAVRARATLGEIAATMRGVFGRYEEVAVI